MSVEFMIRISAGLSAPFYPKIVHFPLIVIIGDYVRFFSLVEPKPKLGRSRIPFEFLNI